MNTDLIEKRQQILREMAGIQRMRRGSFSRQSFRGKGRDKASLGPYYLLQGYRGGRKFSERIPAERAAEVERDVANYRRFQQLAEEFIAITEEMGTWERGAWKKE